MEIADALYGVTMRDDGITAVISQRMRGQELGPAQLRRPGAEQRPRPMGAPRRPETMARCLKVCGSR